MSETKLSDFAILARPVVQEIFIVGQESNRHLDLTSVLATVKKIDSAAIEIPVYSGIGTLSLRDEGRGPEYGKLEQKHSTVMIPSEYAKMLSVTRRAVMDGKGFDILGAQAKALSKASIETRNKNVSSLYNNAFSSSYLGPDGVSLCSTSHPTRGGSGAASNKLATPAPLSEASIEQALIEMASIKDDMGNRLNIRAKKLIVPKDLGFIATRLTGGDERPGTADRDVNAHRLMGMLPEGVFVNHYLSSTSSYFFTTTEDENGLMFVEREALQIANETEFVTGNMLMLAFEMHTVGWGQPFHLFGCTAA